MQELHQDLGETLVAVIEHANMPEPRNGLENGCEAVHGNQGCRAGGFSSPIELGYDAIVIGLEYRPNFLAGHPAELRLRGAGRRFFR